MQQEWTSLLQQTHDLVAQDRHGYPKVQRDLTGLLQSSQSARTRTSRVRSQEEQAAATRLLALRGFDAGRLDQEVTGLELHPTLEDVFHADTSSVEEYLQQIQDMTILTAIQEAQQDTIMSFERLMSDSTSREWAAGKQGLFASVAPFTGLGAGGGKGPGGLSFGSVPHADLASFGGGVQLSPKEQAYISVVKQLNVAAAAKQPVDAVAAFGAACASTEDKSSSTLMSGCWRLLGDVLSRTRGLLPGAPQGAVVQAMVQAEFMGHIRGVISRHRATAQRGADPHPLRDVQAFLLVKFRDRGPLDLSGAGGVDTSWAQVFYSLRAGSTEAALAAAERTSAPHMARKAADAQRGLRQLLEAWLADRAAFQREHGGQLLQDCERLLQAHGARQSQQQIKHDYQLLLYALLAGDSRTIDELYKLNRGLFPTMEDFIWTKLSIVAVTGGSGGGAADGGGGSAAAAASAAAGLPPPAAPFSLAALQAEVNHWGPKYYTKDGREPLLYVTFMLLTLQFRRAVSFLLQDPVAKAFRLDGVHLGIALHFCKVLDVATEQAAPLNLDLPAQLVACGRRYVATDSATALHYYMLAAALAGGGVQQQGRLLRELLVQSRDFGTLLGGGGPLGAGGAIQQFVPDAKQRQALFEAMAYDCQVNQQPDEARELFLAACRPAPALNIINQQLSAAIHSNKGAVTEAVSVLLRRGQAAVEAIAAAPDDGSRRVAAAFQQLVVIRELMEAAAGGQWEAVLQAVTKLTFIPSEQARVGACKADVRQLDDAVGERLSDVLLAAAGAIRAAAAAAGQAPVQLRQRAACLKVFVLDLDPRITPEVFERINTCARELGA